METYQLLNQDCQLKALHFSYIIYLLVHFDIFVPIVMSHDSLLHGFSYPYQIVFTLFNIGIEFTRVNGVDLYTFQLINPNFRVGQLSDFAKNKVVFFVHFE